jgi:hypothetical protein
VKKVSFSLYHFIFLPEMSLHVVIRGSIAKERQRFGRLDEEETRMENVEKERESVH